LIAVFDEFGRDPAVKMMRLVFAQMEAAANDFLNASGISPLDMRLRPWRERARALLERAWATAERKGMETSGEKAGMLYVACLARLMAAEGVEVDMKTLKEGEQILKEVLQ
jgi:hypothetical protein